MPVVSPDEEWDVLSSCELSLLYFSADGIMFLCMSQLFGIYQVQLVHLSSAPRPDIPLLRLLALTTTAAEGALLSVGCL